MKSLASDNYAGVHPDILTAIEEANSGHAIAYGGDSYSQKAKTTFKKHFGDQSEVYFVFTGTAANVLALQALTKPYEAILCAETAHINVDECGAPERFACKLVALPHQDGKLTPEILKSGLAGVGFEHHVQPRVISITQPTELGTIYSIPELKQIVSFAHHHGLTVHMDGARLANAAVALDVPLRALTTDVGIDALSFGGTKNGMMYGDAIVFLSPSSTEGFLYRRKQGLQLASKMRFIATQFDALLAHDLWKRNALHANAMAQYLAACLKNIPQISIHRKVETNAVFAIVPRDIITSLQSHTPFYVWDDVTSEVRWMTAFDTTKADIDDFIVTLKGLLKDRKE